MKIAVAVVYRPPDSSVNSFKAVLKFLEEHITKLDDDSFQIQILGDFNFPSVNWESLIVHPHESQDSALELLRFMSDNLLNQYVHIPTRGDNTLDLFITNNPYLVTNVTGSNTDMSDHDIVDIMISTNPSRPSTSNPLTTRLTSSGPWIFQRRITVNLTPSYSP